MFCYSVTSVTVPSTALGALWLHVANGECERVCHGRRLLTRCVSVGEREGKRAATRPGRTSASLKSSQVLTTVSLSVQPLFVCFSVCRRCFLRVVATSGIHG